MKPTFSLHEREKQIFPVEPLSDADRVCISSKELNKRIKLRWSADGRLHVTATQHVGVLELDCATIQVRPKLAGNELDALAMFDYASEIGKLRRLQHLRAMPGEGRNLRDLVCQLLTESCEDLLRHGLRRDYVRREEARPTVRGRMLHDRQILRRYGRLDRIECRFDDFDSDILDNRLCAVALRLAARTAQDDQVRADAARVAEHFIAVCEPGTLTARLLTERVVYHRGNEIYRPAHQWALLLLRSAGFHDLYSSAGPSGRAFMFDMDVLFEAFIVRLLREAVRDNGLTVRANENLGGIICFDDGTRYTDVRPDIRLVRGNGANAWYRSIDAKYKHYTGRHLSTPDLYQSFS
ncbi:McrC family protein [Nonomuraea jabiensis]|uniref:McrC family protein n=1 Tax=Nonomuraea jabiensis TaxID=882448 RepID=UPI0036A4D7C8